MLYLLKADGTIQRLSTAISAEMDDASDCLVCRDEQNQEVARFPRLDVTMFSTKPLIADDAQPADAAPDDRATRLVRSYLEARDSMLSRVGPVTGQMDAWTDRHSQIPATLRDVAQFEGLRAQRSRLLAEFEDFESEFIAALLSSLVADRTDDTSDAG
jgi:hypothetical protein